MDTRLIKDALPEMLRLLDDANDTRRQIEFEMLGGGPGGGYEEPDKVLPHQLEKLYQILMVVLESSGLTDAIERTANKWLEFQGGKGEVARLDYDAQYEYVGSPALSYLENLVEGLRIVAAPALQSDEAYSLNRLEAILRQTAVLIRRRGITPNNEIEVQHVMHDYLRAFFSDFTTKPQINGSMKNFKPDCGIRNLSAAVEFKIVKTEAAVPVAISGVIEDIGGYQGSKDWTRFYSVFYQFEPFMAEESVREDIKRAGGTTWTPILVNGIAKKRKKRKKARLDSTTKKKKSPEPRDPIVT